MNGDVILDGSMPYLDEVTNNAYEVLGVVGNAVAAENGLKHHYNATFSFITQTFPFAGKQVENLDCDDAYRDEMLNKSDELQTKAKDLGLHVQFEIKKPTGYTKTSMPLVEKTVTYGETRPDGREVEYEHFSVDVESYGCLPKHLTENVDRLSDAGGVKVAVDSIGAARAVYDLIGSFDGYNNQKGNTADVFDLRSEETYTQLQEMVDNEQSRVEDAWYNRTLGLGFGKKTIAHKQEIIKQLHKEFME